MIETRRTRLFTCAKCFKTKTKIKNSSRKYCTYCHDIAVSKSHSIKLGKMKRNQDWKSLEQIRIEEDAKDLHDWLHEVFCWDEGNQLGY